MTQQHRIAAVRVQYRYRCVHCLHEWWSEKLPSERQQCPGRDVDGRMCSRRTGIQQVFSR